MRLTKNRCHTTHSACDCMIERIFVLEEVANAAKLFMPTKLAVKMSRTNSPNRLLSRALKKLEKLDVQTRIRQDL